MLDWVESALLDAYRKYRENGMWKRKGLTSMFCHLEVFSLISINVFFAASRLCSRGACPFLPRILWLIVLFWVRCNLVFYLGQWDLFQTQCCWSTQEQQARELSPLEWNSDFMGEGSTCHCMWQWQELLRTKDLCWFF
jgi:hypothetical protein